MKRRTILSMVAAVLTMLTLAFTIGVESASAQMQNLNCCTYTIDVRNTIPANCFPIHVEVEWGPGIRQLFAFVNPGVYVLNVPPPCPPAFLFNWVRVLPGGPMIVLGQTAVYMLPGCNYLATYTAQLDANGCVYITIW
jgi:hypothetical protein